MVARIFRVQAALFMLTVGVQAQDAAPEPLVRLPEIPAYKISDDRYLILHGRVASSQAESPPPTTTNG